MRSAVHRRIRSTCRALSTSELAYAEEHPEYLVATGMPREDAEQYTLTSYIRRMVEADRDLRDTTKLLYLRNLRVHIEGTKLGQTADPRPGTICPPEYEVTRQCFAETGITTGVALEGVT